MKKINLDEIASEYLKGHSLSTRLFIYDSMINAMREACHQAIELAAENAKIVTKMREDVDELSMLDEWTISTIDKQSILSTKSQII